MHQDGHVRVEKGARKKNKKGIGVGRKGSWLAQGGEGEGSEKGCVWVI